ncbi:hypothetical protein SARC_10859, partial [Sphaeroforma arctica JP610]
MMKNAEKRVVSRSPARVFLLLTIIGVLVVLSNWRYKVFDGLTMYSLNVLSSVPAKTGITLIIPALAYDFNRFGNDFLRSMESLTVVPDEMFVVVSNTSSTLVNMTVYNDLKSQFIDFQNKHGIVGHFIEYPDPMKQAVKKNLASACATTEWLSVFDIDDILHPQRFEMLSSLFKQQPHIEVVLTTFEGATTKEIGEKLEKLSHYDSNEIADLAYDPDSLREQFEARLDWLKLPYTWCCVFINEFISNGWLTIKRDLWLKYQQRGDLDIGEDIEMITRLITTGVNTTVLEMNLGIYRYKTKVEGKKL